MKAAMDEKGTSMTDAGPLVRIKQSLMRLKAESTQMEVRIGVVRVRGGGGKEEHGRRERDQGGGVESIAEFVQFQLEFYLSSLLLSVRDMVCD